MNNWYHENRINLAKSGTNPGMFCVAGKATNLAQAVFVDNNKSKLTKA